MLAINYLVCVLPYILFVLVIYLIYNTITEKQKNKKLNIRIIAPILIISIILAAFYLPDKSIMKNYNTDFVHIHVKEQDIEIKDEGQIN